GSTSPRSIASAKRAAVKVFVIEPISNSVRSSAPVPAKVISSPSMRAAAMCCQCLLPRACSSSAMSSASPVGVPWKPRGHGVSAARATAVSIAAARAMIRRRGARPEPAEAAAGGLSSVSVIVPPRGRGGKCGGQGRDARRPRHSVRGDEDQREQRDDPRARDLPVPATDADQPSGPGEGVHVVIDLTGRAEALVLAELGHGGRALVDRLEQLQPNGVAEREIGRASCREREQSCGGGGEVEKEGYM